MNNKMNHKTPKNFTYSVWPSKTLRATVCKINSTTGEIVKIKELGLPHTKSWWKARGFSFNGKLSAFPALLQSAEDTRRAQ